MIQDTQLNDEDLGPHLDLYADVVDALKKSFKDNELHLNKVLQVLTLPPMYTTLRCDLRPGADIKRTLDILRTCLAEQCHELGRETYDMFQHPKLKDCIVLRNRGPHTVAQVEKEVIVDLACGMAVLRGAHVYKQGIIGAPHCLSSGDVVSVYADLDGKCLKGLATNYTGKKIHVGNGIAQVQRSDLYNSSKVKSTGVGILMSQPVYEAPSLSEVNMDWIFPQNLPSIACIHALDPQPGDTILDMCAAPGGKTTHIASLLQGQGRVVALEKSSERAKRMEKLQTKCMEIYAFDSTKAVLPQADPSGGPPYPPATYDRILVDAPCSALGQRPYYVNKISINQLKSFPIIQHKLLLAAVELLKPGGVLVYSTCTITSEENEDQISRLLSKCPQMEIISMPFTFGSSGLPGCDLTEEQRSKVKRFDPSVLDASLSDEENYNIDTIGFFIAKLQKKKEGLSSPS